MLRDLAKSLDSLFHAFLNTRASAGWEASDGSELARGRFEPRRLERDMTVNEDPSPFAPREDEGVRAGERELTQPLPRFLIGSGGHGRDYECSGTKCKPRAESGGRWIYT